VKQVDMERGKNYLVVAVGTGLGIALIISLRPSTTFQVLPMEFGHTLISSSAKNSKNYEEDLELEEFISKKIYGGNHLPEYEDLVSGRGLGYIYEFVVRNSEDRKKLKAEEIVKKAEEGCENCIKAVSFHFRYLMKCLKDLSVGLLAEGIFLAGSNQVSNNTIFENYMSEWSLEYLSHPKHSWIQEVEWYTQMEDFNINLHGALFVAETRTTS